MPADVKTQPPPAPAESDARPTLQGLVADARDEKALVAALEQAFDYRGDVTLTLTGGEAVTGYIFDRRSGASLADSLVRLLPADGTVKRTVRYSEIARVEFTGRDAAHGKTFDNWIKRYVESKRAGKTASIESETLE